MSSHSSHGTAAAMDAQSSEQTRELRADELSAISGGRTIPNGRTDIIKAMGNNGKSVGTIVGGMIGAANS